MPAPRTGKSDCERDGACEGECESDGDRDRPSDLTVVVVNRSRRLESLPPSLVNGVPPLSCDEKDWESDCACEGEGDCERGGRSRSLAAVAVSFAVPGAVSFAFASRFRLTTPAVHRLRLGPSAQLDGSRAKPLKSGEFQVVRRLLRPQSTYEPPQNPHHLYCARRSPPVLARLRPDRPGLRRAQYR